MAVPATHLVAHGGAPSSPRAELAALTRPEQAGILGREDLKAAAWSTVGPSLHFRILEGVGVSGSESNKSATHGW